MKSLLVWLSGVAFGAMFFVCLPSAKAQTPGSFTYRGTSEGIYANDHIESANKDSVTTAQTQWAGRITVPPSTGTSLAIQNEHVMVGSTIIIAPEDSMVASGGCIISSVGSGTFTVSLPNVIEKGTGRVTALNYRVINPGSDRTNMVLVPSTAGTSFVIKDSFVTNVSTIMISPVFSSAATDSLTITAVSAGSFTVSSKSAMGSGDGAITAINYEIVNH